MNDQGGDTRTHYLLDLKIDGAQQGRVVNDIVFTEIKSYLGVVPCEQVETNADTDFYSIKDFWKDFPKARKGTSAPAAEKHLQELKGEVFFNLSLKQRDDATELITQEFLKNNHVYTIRHDEKAESWIYNEGIYVPHAKTYLKEFCQKILDKTYTTHLFNAVYAKVEVRTFINQQDFFIVENPYLIPVQNGILDLRTKELREFTPNLFFFNKLPMQFNPEQKCPEIESFFGSILDNDSDIQVLQELFGFLMLKDYKFERAFMFTGNGRNGKGKTVELMKRFLGMDNCANIALEQLERDQYAIGELFNKLANLSADISPQALKNTGNFKSLTGHDLMSASRKFLPMVNFTNYAKFVFCANELPRTEDLSNAFFARWIIIDFPFQFVPEDQYNRLSEKERTKTFIQDTNKIDKISTDEELTGLLNWALIGFERLILAKGFSDAKSTEETKQLWIRKSNSVMGFLQENLEENWGKYVLKRDLRLRYRDYCRTNKLKSMSDRVIKHTLEEQFGTTDSYKVLEHKEHVWLDIGWKKDTEKYLTYIDKSDPEQTLI